MQPKHQLIKDQLEQRKNFDKDTKEIILKGLGLFNSYQSIMFHRSVGNGFGISYPTDNDNISRSYADYLQINQIGL